MHPPTSTREWRVDQPLGRAGLAVVGAALLALLAYRWLIPYAGPWPVESPEVVDVVIGVGGEFLWIWATLLALHSRRTVRLGWLLVLFTVADLVWTLGNIQVHALYYLSDAFRGLGSAVLAHVLIAFPTGRLRSRFDRTVVPVIYAFTIVTATLRLLAWDPVWTCDPYCPRNPFAAIPNEGFSTWLATATPALVPALAALVLVSIWRHWRAAGQSGRRVLQPVALATPFQMAVASAGYTAQAFGWQAVLDVLAHPLIQLTAIILPSAFLLGLLRARLARGRIAELALSVGRGVPLGGLRDVLARTLGDPSLQLAFAVPDGGGFVDPDGRPIDVVPGPARGAEQVVRDGELLAVILHDPAIHDEDPEILRAVGSVAGLALENERLSAQVRAQLEEVRASRQRIVEAGDAQRRRVERDLHDGAQQRLVALAMRLEAARDTTADTKALIDATTAELGTAIAEVRDLARGLHPPILTEAGLRAAIESLAERTPIPVEVEADDVRYPAPIEATAYYVIAESLTNIARHAAASHARVTIRRDGDAIVVQVSDDGAGGADQARGSGLSGLRDRVAALGGSLDVESTTGSGTTIRARLPLAASTS